MINSFNLAVLLAFSLFDPSSLHIKCAFVANGYQAKEQFLATMTITNTGDRPMPAKGWSIYFCLRYHEPLETQDSGFTVRHIEGDLYCIRPNPAFRGLEQGHSAVLSFTGSGRIANYQDLPSGLFWVADADTARAIALHRVAYDPGSLPIKAEPEIPIDVPDDSIALLIPTPASCKKDTGFFLLDGHAGLAFDPGFKKEAAYLSSTLESLISPRNPSGSGPRNPSVPRHKQIILRKAPLPAEAYDLVITPDSLVISASTGAGIFYGIQTIKHLLPAAAWKARHSRLTIPCLRIEDEPRFPVREFMLDVSRNFQQKDEIMKLLDLMALYKLNTFHFHLTDDEGWRLEIPGLPELTSIGAERGYPFSSGQRLHPSFGSGPDPGNPAGSGYYSKKDFIGMLKYADTLHIRVIPEIDMPAHSSAAVRSMLARYRHYSRLGDRAAATHYLLSDTDSHIYNVIDPVLPSVDHFIEKVTNEVVLMYKEAGVDGPVIHMGGDEVPPSTAWNANLFHLFFVRIDRLLRQKGITLNTWEELAIGTDELGSPRKVQRFPDLIDSDVRVDAWYNITGNESVPYQLANAGYKTTLSCLDYFYFDLACKKSFYEPGDEWLGLLDTKKVLSFMPYDYYRNTTRDLTGKEFPSGYFTDKERLTEQGKQNIIGIQGALWGENITSAGLMEYMILPRLLALAEKAWTKAPDWETSPDSLQSQRLFERYWNQFEVRLNKYELPKLNAYHGGYHFR
jgi:hexosaminidase